MNNDKTKYFQRLEKLRRPSKHVIDEKKELARYLDEKYIISPALTDAIMIFAEGRISHDEASELAEKYAEQFDTEKYPLLGHKGLNWYAKEILKANKIVPKNYSWSHMEYQLKKSAILTEEQKQEIREAAKHEIVFDEDCPEITEEKFRELKEKGLVWRNRYAERIDKKDSSTDKEN